MVKRAGLKSGEPLIAEGQAFTLDSMREIHREVSTQLRADPVILGNLFENWLRSIHRYVEAAHGEPPSRLALVRQKLLDGSASWQDLNELAHLAGMSPSHFSARFREHYGVSPGRFQQVARIERAKRIMRLGSTSLSETAEQLGFTDLFSFSRSFKRVVGMSPRKWLNEIGESGSDAERPTKHY